MRKANRVTAIPMHHPSIVFFSRCVSPLRRLSPDSVLARQVEANAPCESLLVRVYTTDRDREREINEIGARSTTKRRRSSARRERSKKSKGIERGRRMTEEKEERKRSETAERGCDRGRGRGEEATGEEEEDANERSRSRRQWDKKRPEGSLPTRRNRTSSKDKSVANERRRGRKRKRGGTGKEEASRGGEGIRGAVQLINM